MFHKIVFLVCGSDDVYAAVNRTQIECFTNNKNKIMSLENEIMTAIKEAMKAKDQTALAALRAVKSEILLARTSGTSDGLTEEEEVKLVQKLVKQRKDSARIFSEQNREDLSEPELAQAAVLEQFLPEQLSEEEITKVVTAIIAKTGAAGMKDMGKVMGMANKELAGKADGRTISAVVKAQLT
jgi:uncharacterized protein YqeY